MASEQSSALASSKASRVLASSESVSSLNEVVSGISYTYVPETGTTGSCAWTLTADGHLTVSGKGEMKDYEWGSGFPPWKNPPIASLTIEPGVTRIGHFAFLDAEITSVAVPDSVTEIGRFAFQGCKNLKSVTLGSGLIRIRYCAFCGCSSLTEIVLPDGLKYIEGDAFLACTSLRRVVIPASVTDISDTAFYRASFTIATIHGSRAESYAKSFGLPIEYLD